MSSPNQIKIINAETVAQLLRHIYIERCRLFICNNIIRQKINEKKET